MRTSVESALRIGPPPLGWGASLKRRHMLRRVTDDAIVTVQARDGVRVRLIRTDPSGMVLKRARAMTRTDWKAETEFQPFRPCRWMLYCQAQATFILPIDEHGLDVCDQHSVDYLAWLAGDMRDRAPEPECMCPDVCREYVDPVAYCPAHGTPQERGTEISKPDKLLTWEGTL